MDFENFNKETKRFEIAIHIMYHTMLQRLAIFKIIQELKTDAMNSQIVG
jgi:hypothetical protein